MDDTLLQTAVSAWTAKSVPPHVACSPVWTKINTQSHTGLTKEGIYLCVRPLKYNHLG